MSRLFRLSNHPLVRWWWGMDRVSFFIIIALMFIGGAALASASIAVVDTYHTDPYHFFVRQLPFLALALFAILFGSFLSPASIRFFMVILFILSMICMALVPFIGTDVKGATRWINVLGASLQPSELLKPSFTIVTAILISTMNEGEKKRRVILSILLMALVAVLLLVQPDFGMLIMLGSVWGIQMLVSGVSVVWLTSLAGLGLSVVAFAYFFLSHVRSRIDRFFDPSSGDTYQTDQARDAFLSGGLFGRGPGEGVVKHTLPDAHTDFIFAVIGEEFGILACLFLLFAYGVFVYRSFARLLLDEDRFVVIAGAGLLFLFGAQTLVNMCVVLNILPTTGMTLPFISYGGSGTLAMGIVVGLILAFTRKRGKYLP